MEVANDIGIGASLGLDPGSKITCFSLGKLWKLSVTSVYSSVQWGIYLNRQLWRLN